MASLSKIEGIGPATVKKFAKGGIITTEGLLKAAKTKAGRKKVAAACGISEKMILEHLNRADLMRVKGVGEEYSDLLEASGVDTCKELKGRKPENLHAKMLEVNTKKKLVRRPPSQSEVTRWVAHAKTLKPGITY